MEQSMWARYVRELRGEYAPKFIEHDWGFVSYSMQPPDVMFIEDFYVKPEERGGNTALGLLGEAEADGKASGATQVACGVRVDSPLAAKNLRIYLSMGFVPTAAHDGRIVLARKIKVGE